MDRKKTGVLAVILALLLLGGCGSLVEQSNSLDNGRGKAGERPGLSVVYIFEKYRSVDQIPVGEAALRMGRQGKPVLVLNHRSGKEENVFDSGRSQKVAMVMDGFLNLDRSGEYRFQALANDGIRIFVNGRMILEDPRVHGDRLSPVGVVRVEKPGRYPVRILYFQRKGTAALKLYWQPPGAGKFTLVPAAAYSH